MKKKVLREIQMIDDEYSGTPLAPILLAAGAVIGTIAFIVWAIVELIKLF